MSITFANLAEAQKNYLEDCFTLHSSVLACRQQEFRASVEHYGLEFTKIVHQEPITIQSGSTIKLSTTPDQHSHLVPQLCSTDQFSQFKDWIGIPDDQFETGIFPLPTQPSAQWLQTEIPKLAQLSDTEKENIQTAGFAYLFGNSKLVESYQSAIEALHAPFEAVAYVIDCLTIEPDASLIVQGTRPAILLFNRLNIIHGGTIKLYCPTALTVQRLHKQMN
jgi:hypothetical protein